MQIAALLTPCGGFFFLMCRMMIRLSQVEAENCAWDTGWEMEGVRKTLQAWLDTQEKGNITGQTGDYI